MSVYYNEIDPFAAAWLRVLMKANQIPDGEVDERSIELVRPDDLRGFRQCHFFAGIGGWAYALRLAGWPEDREAWTGSCPCQPFSAAGRTDGADDSRHLWPTWFELWRQCRPVVGFGEQVASIHGLAWLDRVYTDLEGEDYAVAAVDLGAPSVGAFHRRQRLFFVADASSTRRQQNRGGAFENEGEDGRQSYGDYITSSNGAISGMGHSADFGCFGWGVDHGSIETCDRTATTIGRVSGQQASERCAARAFWADADWITCLDGKARAIEPGSWPLAHGVPARVGRLRGYGNAIVPQVAQVFIEAYLDCERIA